MRKGPDLEEDQGGWVRIGFASLTGAAPGKGNCDAWSSDDGADSGTVIRMVSDWIGGGEDVGPGNAEVRSCDHGFLVWCVQDHRHFRVYLPLMSKG